MSLLSPADKARTKQVNEILPHLYLTSIFGATRENIYAKSIKVLINSAQELPKAEHDGVHSLKLDLHDRKDETIYVHFDWVADLIHQNVSNSKAVLVHCVMGISRSTSLIIAYLMKYHRMTLKDAIIHVRSRRTIIRPNSGFMKQLINYEQLLKYNSYYNHSNSYYYENNNNISTLNNSDGFVNKENGYNSNNNYLNTYTKTFNNSTVLGQNNSNIYYTNSNDSTFNEVGYKPSLSSPSLSEYSPLANLPNSQSYTNIYSSPLNIQNTNFITQQPHQPHQPQHHQHQQAYKPYIEITTSEIPDWYINKEHIQTN